MDIETTPHLGYFWGLWDQNIGIDMIVEPSRVLCVSAKWVGEPTMWDKGEAGLRLAWDCLDAADAVVHYNGERFDVKRLNQEFALREWGLPAPFKNIDLMKTAKARFDLPSNKLAYVARFFGVGVKGETGGFETWKGCMADDAKAWKKMEKYNRQDVTLTEQLYDRLLPYIPNHPNRNLYGDSGCPVCATETVLQRRGYYYTKGGQFVKYQCQKCMQYFRSTSRVAGTSVTEAIR